MVRTTGNGNCQHTRKKARKANEAFRTEIFAKCGDCRTAAEVKQIDDEEIRNAANDRGVAVGDSAKRAPAGNLRPGSKNADGSAKKEAQDGERHAHQCTHHQHVAPAVGPEAQNIEKAHLLHDASGPVGIGGLNVISIFRFCLPARVISRFRAERVERYLESD